MEDVKYEFKITFLGRGPRDTNRDVHNIRFVLNEIDLDGGYQTNIETIDVEHLETSKAPQEWITG